MNILLWILQGLLAFWNVTGGVYTAINYEKIRSTFASDFPVSVWIAIGALQVLFALGLVVPGSVVGLPKLTSISATYLAIYSLSGLILAAKYSGFPGMLWGVIPAIMCAFVAYGRMG